MAEENAPVAENEQPKATQEVKLINREWKELSLFTNSMYYEKTISKKSLSIPAEQEEKFKFINTCMNQIAISFKDADITKEDLDALCFEIGMDITEENAHKARAVIGRWLTKIEFTDLYALMEGIIKFGCLSDTTFQYGRTFTQFVTNELHLGSNEAPYNLVLPACLVIGWCMIIESGVAATHGEKENKTVMPSTMERCIFIELLGHNVFLFRKERLVEALGTLFNFFINNINRIGNNQPHPSEAAYLTCSKRALVAAGGDPYDFIYRATDNNNQNWNLFSFIVEDNV